MATGTSLQKASYDLLASQAQTAQSLQPHELLHDPIAEKMLEIRDKALSTPPTSPSKANVSPLKPSPKASESSPNGSVSSPTSSPTRRLRNSFSSTLALKAVQAGSRVMHRLSSMEVDGARPRTLSLSLSSRLEESAASSSNKRTKETSPAEEVSKFFSKKGKELVTPFHSYAKAIAAKGVAGKGVAGKGGYDLSYREFTEKIYPSFVKLVTAVPDLAALDQLVQKKGDKAKRDEIHSLMVELVENLHKCGIKGIRTDQKVLFWSGLAAMLEAENDPEGVSDSGIPVFITLFAFWKKICLDEEGKRLLGSLLPNLFSYMFARYAQGEVCVRISSTSKDSTETCLNANSAFSAVELPTLLDNEKVTKVLVSTFDQATGTWSLPIDFKSKDPAEVAKKMALQTSLREGGKPLPFGSMLKFCKAWKKVLSDESSC